MSDGDGVSLIETTLTYSRTITFRTRGQGASRRLKAEIQAALDHGLQKVCLSNVLSNRDQERIGETIKSDMRGWASTSRVIGEE